MEAQRRTLCRSNSSAKPSPMSRGGLLINGEEEFPPPKRATRGTPQYLHQEVHLLLSASRQLSAGGPSHGNRPISAYGRWRQLPPAPGGYIGPAPKLVIRRRSLTKMHLVLTVQYQGLKQTAKGAECRQQRPQWQRFQRESTSLITIVTRLSLCSTNGRRIRQTCIRKSNKPEGSSRGRRAETATCGAGWVSSYWQR